ncbi:DNA alkylation repair protein [Glaciecola sp. 1036]|uniref:DNA alkylation repair protein n=1 Tax=Alteromonadaceae TaxID=72275 RepID=UPI003CFE651C
MPEAFKEKFSISLIRTIADGIAAQAKGFNAAAFVGTASENLSNLELKQRSTQITLALDQHLQGDFSELCDHLVATLTPMQSHDDLMPDQAQSIDGWAIMPMADFITLRGLRQPSIDKALWALQQMTKRFTAEFAIRPFLLERTSETLEKLQQWVVDPSHHVRRLVSEGTRPRLPWGIQLTDFVREPGPVLSLLSQLKDDNSEYVRRSVANNLNDIGKDHPERLIETARLWNKKTTPFRQKLVRHACRTLLKKGNPEVLDIFGYAPPQLKNVSITLSKKKVCQGDDLLITLKADSRIDQEQSLMIDYRVYHKKANGQLSPKVFKWKILNLAANGKLSASKKHSFKPVTTRKYYAGEHKIAVLINGVEYSANTFYLEE